MLSKLLPSNQFPTKKQRLADYKKAIKLFQDLGSKNTEGLCIVLGNIRYEGGFNKSPHLNKSYPELWAQKPKNADSVWAINNSAKVCNNKRIKWLVKAIQIIEPDFTLENLK